MTARLRLAVANEAVRPRPPEPLLPPALTLFALVDPRGGDGAPEIEITDEMVRAALDSIDCEAVTPYRDGVRPVVARRADAAAARRTAEIIPFPGPARPRRGRHAGSRR